MTCPFQYYVYKSEQHSYRDLPIRMGETSTLFRSEDSVEMHGLTRVRQFTILRGISDLRRNEMVEEFKGRSGACKILSSDAWRRGGRYLSSFQVGSQEAGQIYRGAGGMGRNTAAYAGYSKGAGY